MPALNWLECGLRGRTAGKREETHPVSSLLSITHFPFRARFARKVRNGRLPAAHLSLSNKKGGCHPVL